MASQWVTALLAFLGAGLGAALSYAAALRGDRLRETAARREEWGRRFTSALTDMGDDSARRRMLGQVLLEQLVTSQLASDEERNLAREVLTESAAFGPGGQDLLRLSVPELEGVSFLPEGTDLDTGTLTSENGGEGSSPTGRQEAGHD